MPFESPLNSSSSTTSSSSSHSQPPSYRHANPPPQPQQKVSVGRLNSLKKSCEQCRKRRRVCNSERPCAHCKEAHQDCVYSVVTDHSRGVFSTQAARRLSSGSACETCRRRKTKCDGASPCNFCATNNIDCVNNSERRHVNKHHGGGKSTIAGATAAAAAPGEAMDRIEDRLRRIERLMTAFTPSPLSTSSSLITNDPHHLKTGASHKVRPCRHSVQGINVAKEQLELKSKYEIKRRGNPVSIMRPSNSQTSIAHSMLNLSISPSSSSTMSSGIHPNQPYPLASTSSPSMSSSYDVPYQLSKRTFATSAVDYTITHYPIYPLTPPPSQSRTSPSLQRPTSP
ncbi:hypothetical protein FB192DRAFT_1286846 [Mucor lusitanicus]|uniref:Zn(2)-C6 fungal-type domain-containing protein n=1 Tax=Mucor circinelloides f. lusitanicus TaxID=29924 RepID=A0A8H4BCB5_MUCCL|nr:hypothetical protein FB192DRAFT_1286846 [Mucor lusitanicus]